MQRRSQLFIHFWFSVRGSWAKYDTSRPIARHQSKVQTMTQKFETHNFFGLSSSIGTWDTKSSSYTLRSVGQHWAIYWPFCKHRYFGSDTPEEVIGNACDAFVCWLVWALIWWVVLKKREGCVWWMTSVLFH